MATNSPKTYRNLVPIAIGIDGKAHRTLGSILPARGFPEDLPMQLAARWRAFRAKPRFEFDPVDLPRVQVEGRAHHCRIIAGNI